MNDANLPRKNEATKAQIGELRGQRSYSAPIVGGLLLIGGFASYLFLDAGLWAFVAAGSGAVVLVLARRRGGPSPATTEPSEAELSIKELKRYVSKTQYLENMGDLGERATEQMEQVSRRFTTFQELLAVKFEAGEITYARYYGTAEKVYLGVLENLRLAATTLNTVDSTDPRYIRERMKELTDKGDNGEETNNLEERLRMRDHEITTVTELLALNEKAITEFDRVRVALAATQTKKGVSDTGLESVMADLAILAERAKKYEITPS